MRSIQAIPSFFILLLLIVNPPTLSAREKDSTNISIGISAEFVSSFIWRGLVSDLAPNIQPSLSVQYKNWEAGIWGSANFQGTYREVDPWISYRYKNITFTVNDYFYTPNDTLRFFNYSYERTGHLLEGAVTWEGPETFPLTLTASTFFLGPDNTFDHYDSLTGITYVRNQYSSYLEASFPFTIQNTEAEAFIGGTPTEGYYGAGAGIINLGLKATRNIYITDNFILPVTGSIIINPQTGSAYFVLCIKW